MGGIYGGVFTPTEAAGIGAAGALVFAWLQGGLTVAALVEVLTETAVTTATVFAVLFGALLFSNFINVAGLPAALASWAGGLDLPPAAIVACMLAVYLVLGCVLEEDEVRALPDAPSLRLPDDGVELSAVVHPSILGALDDVRPRLDACGVVDLVPATKGELVVLAVVVADGVSPDPALRRAGTLLADRGLTGPVLVPSTSLLGQAVLDVTDRG